MIGWASERPAVVWASALALVLGGGVALARLPVATRAVVELPRLRVSASWPGASAELVEAYVSAPIEAAVQSVRGVRRTDSESNEARSQLTVRLEPDAEVQLVRLAILERLELLRADLPEGVSSPRVANYVPDELAEQPLLRYTLSGPYTAGTLARLARLAIVPRVSAVPGVAGVGVSGGAETGVSVAYDGWRLRALGLKPEALSDALRQSRIVRPLGVERTGASVREVVLRDEPSSVQALAELPVPLRGGQVLRLGDLADVRLEEDARGSFYRVNGEPAVALTVSRLPGADAIRSARAVRGVLDELTGGLPIGVKLRVQSDETVDLARKLQDLAWRGMVALVAVLAVLALALRNARAVGLALGSVVVAVAGTALGLYLLDIPANLLTLAGLGMGIGILVQNGVVVVERLRSAPDTPEGRAEAGRGIAAAILGATLTTAVVLLPFLYLQGNARAAFVPFAVAFVMALGWSVVSSVVMIPAVAGGLKLRPRVWPRLLRGYVHVVVKLLRWRFVTLVLTVGLMGLASWGFAKKVPRSTFGSWYDQRPTLSASLYFPRGSDPASLDAGMHAFESIVVGREGVAQVVAQGSRDGAYLVVTFTDAAARGSAPYEMEDELTQRAILIGGAQVGVRYQGPGYYSGGGGATSQFRIKLLGYSFDGLARIAEDLKRRLERIPRVREVDVNAGSFWQRERAVSVTLDPDRAALGRYGLTAADLARDVAREVQGPVGAQRIVVAGEELRVTLKAAGTTERSLDELRAAFVPNRSGAPVRFADVARVGEREELARISRQDQQYVRVVSYEFRGPPRLAERTHRSFMRSISVPPGYSAADDRFEWDEDESVKGLWVVFGVGVLLVVLSVAMVFDSVWATAMVFLSLPVALAGSAASFWIAGTAFTREAAVGVILVVGLAVNQSILLVDAALKRRRAGARRSRPLNGADVVRACRDRAGMIVFVTLTTLASLLPLAVGTDPDQLFGAIALATAGGTLAGTVGAMLVVPALLARWRPRMRSRTT